MSKWKKNKRTHNDKQNTTQKIDDWVWRTPLKHGTILIQHWKLLLNFSHSLVTFCI
jgi:hypothetical protein